MRLPLTVRERLVYFELVDADGRVIARHRAFPWHGAAEEDRPEIVRENFRRLAEAMNKR